MIIINIWSVSGAKNAKSVKAKKSKLILFNDILLKENLDNVDGYLCCNDCSKMTKVLDDPIYKTLNEKQRMLFKFVRLFPFPKTIKALKDEFSCMSYAIKITGCNFNRLNKNIFSILKFVYENLFIDWSKDKGLMSDLLKQTVEEMNKIIRKNKVDKTLAFIYIRDFVQDLESIYQCKSSFGMKVFEKERTSKDYINPSYRKYLRFSLGDKFSLYYIIHSNLIKGFS